MNTPEAYKNVGSAIYPPLEDCADHGRQAVREPHGPEPFENPFDRLTVLSKVEGLKAPRKMEGGIEGVACHTSGFGLLNQST